jgi:hypothetical protein
METGILTFRPSFGNIFVIRTTKFSLRFYPSCMRWTRNKWAVSVRPRVSSPKLLHEFIRNLKLKACAKDWRGNLNVVRNDHTRSLFYRTSQNRLLIQKNRTRPIYKTQNIILFDTCVACGMQCNETDYLLSFICIYIVVCATNSFSLT